MAAWKTKLIQTVDEFRQSLPVIILRGAGQNDVGIRASIKIIERAVLQERDAHGTGNLEGSAPGRGSIQDRAASAAQPFRHSA